MAKRPSSEELQRRDRASMKDQRPDVKVPDADVRPDLWSGPDGGYSNREAYKMRERDKKKG